MNRLAQIAPNANTLTTLYKVPYKFKCTVGGFKVCNRGAVDATFRIALVPKGAADHVRQYIYYDVELPANTTFTSDDDLVLPTEMEVKCYASTSDLSFSVHLMEFLTSNG